MIAYKVEWPSFLMYCKETVHSKWLQKNTGWEKSFYIFILVYFNNEIKRTHNQFFFGAKYASDSITQLG